VSLWMIHSDEADVSLHIILAGLNLVTISRNFWSNLEWKLLWARYALI
jgi:hypothetical protein